MSIHDGSKKRKEFQEVGGVLLITYSITYSREDKEKGVEGGQESFNLGGRKLEKTSGQVLLSLFMLSVLSVTCLNCNLITLLIFVLVGVGRIKLTCTCSKIGEIIPAAASRC